MILRSTDIRAALRDRRSRLAPRRSQRGFFTLPGGMGAAGKGPSGATDPDFASVVLLMHFDGADGSTTFTDNSSSAKTLTAVGNAQLDTAQQRFGTASGLLDGSGDYVSAAASTDFEFGSGNVTIEGWLRLSDVANFSVFYTEDGNTSLHVDADRWVWRANNTNVFVTADTIPANTWFHFAFVRNGSTSRVYRDAVMVATGTSVDCANSNSAIRIGTGYLSLTGHIDELRITKGVARYTAAGFTVPTAAFPDS